MVSRFVANGPVKQEGICLIPQHPQQHYRIIAPSRTDGYHVATPPSYVQPPPNQGNNQGPPLRGMPTGPPNQASTPPNSDLKVQMSPQQPSMNIAYVSQMPMRGPAQNMYARAPQPTTQSSRMPNHRQGQQQIYQTQQFLPISMQPSVSYINSGSQYYNSAPRPQPGFVSPFQMIPGQIPAYQYTAPAQSQPTTFFYSTPQMIPRQQLSSVATIQQNPPQPAASTVSLPPQPQQLNTVNSKKRRFAIPIIDPNTGKDKLNEMFEQEDSHPTSGESSARQTPQPPLHNSTKEVQAAFARQVTEAIKDEELPIMEEFESAPITYSLPPQPMPHPRFDPTMHSNLQVATKEFIPAAALNNAAKEITPVVSAITDAVEVTITNKPKDRESPVKGRKHREQTNISIKEPVTLKDKEDTTISEKPVSINKEEIKVKDSIANITQTKENIVPDKKIPKKEVSKPAPAIPVPVEENKQEEDEILDSAPLPSPESAATQAKSKHASTKNKELPKQQQVPIPIPVESHPQHVRSTSPPEPITQKVTQSIQSSPPPPPIPVTQPTKPNNKTSKMRDINLKGALKEGTDMDAFNDNTEEDSIQSMDYVNSDYVNNDNNTILNNNEDANKNNDITTIKPIIETKPKSKFDVMDIVKDTPKPLKPVTVQTPVETSDEVDRAVIANEKLVQAKNEANSKASAEIIDTNVPDSKLSILYGDDQWSPINPEGKKIYPIDFLMALRNVPKSKLKPDNILQDIMANDARGRMGDMNRYAVGSGGGGGRQTDFAPNFGNNVYTNKNSSQRGTIVKRKSQQGAPSSTKTGGRPSVIRVSISVKEDVKLREVENAWRPARCVHGDNMNEDEKKTAELYRRFRGVLNKLTPQKFKQLVEQVRTLNIDTSERLQGVIDLVFEKAVDEPNFSVAYASLCKELSLMQVPTGPVDIKRKEKDNQPVEYVNFRKLLVTRCQLEFEKNSFDESERNEKLKEIDACEDLERKKDMQIDLDEYDRRLRMKSVGNIRFIGELFKQNMLTSNIMLRCLNNLLANKDEESLECLCKLMSTVGKELELRKVDLNPIFVVMKEIVDKKHGNVSSRVRFMIQDVIDLRISQWVPRRQDFNPKTMEQIQKEAETEQLLTQALNTGPNVPPRKDDRSSNINMNNERRAPRRNMGTDDGGWMTPQARNNRGNVLLNVQSDKLKTVMPLTDEPFGNSGMFGNWSTGSNVKHPPVASNNKYSALENIDGDKRPAINVRPHVKDDYNSKGASLERNYRPFEDDRGSRSGSQHRSRDNSSVSQHNQQSSMPPPSIPSAYVPPSVSTVVMQKDQPPIAPSVIEMTPEQFDNQLKKILEDYLVDFDITECDNDIRRLFPPSELPKIVTEGYNSVLERSKDARSHTGELFAKLIKLDTLSVEDYCIGLTNVLEFASDLIIDIPKLWDYLGELIAPVICEGAITMKQFHNCCGILVSQNYASKLLIAVFRLIIKEKVPNFLHSIWNSSALSFSDFMPQSQVDSFIQDNKLEFLLQTDCSHSESPSFKSTPLSQEQIYNKLLELFKSNTSFDDTVNWIMVNLGERVKENQFIRTLATACFQESIVQDKFKFAILKNKFNILLRYVDTKPEYELQCLYALQALINQLEHPSGLLLTIFDKIYEENLFSHESFLAWEKSTDPAEQEGKGVSLKQLTSFFTQLKEVEDDEDDSCGSAEG